MCAVFEREGLTFRYFDAGAGNPLVFQHGLAADAGQVARILGGIPGARLITLECRGHGGSDLGPPERLSIATFADDVIALCAFLGIRRATFGGISMGAAIAQRIATIRADLVGRLVLARPAWVDHPAPSNMRPFLEVAALLASATRQEARRRFLAGATAAELARLAPDNLVSLLGMFDKPDPVKTAELVSRIAVDGPGTDLAALAAIDVPTLLIAQQADHVHPIASAWAMRRLIAVSTLLEITPKAIDRERHESEFRAAVGCFLCGSLGAGGGP